MESRYSVKEERLNILTHAFGFLLSIIALVLLIDRSTHYSSASYFTSILIFGISLVLLYGSSTIYHWVKKPHLKKLFKSLDHVAIYFLIAGTYTPFTIVTLGDDGKFMLILIWSLAITGAIFKIFFAGKFRFLSTFLYIVMGWVSLFMIGPIIEAIPWNGFLLLSWGGIVYTLGAIFYLLDRLPNNHAVWHVFVIGGSFLHFLSIFYYVVPL